MNGTVKGRRGARLAALTSGGAIPELGDFRVIAEPDEAQVGSVHEEWAVESRPGDVFLLGTHSWRIRRVEPGTVRVVDAHGAPPSVPHWQGEAPGRTRELSEEVSALRQAVADRAPEEAGSGWRPSAVSGGPRPSTIVAYLHTGLAALGALPTMDAIILERFFDEAGGMQLIGHAPFGARVNRAFGLALRKRFCVTFDFELQAAASDNAILLSLGPQHSFPLDAVPRFLASASVEQVVRQAVLTSCRRPRGCQASTATRQPLHLAIVSFQRQSHLASYRVPFFNFKPRIFAILAITSHRRNTTPSPLSGFHVQMPGTSCFSFIVDFLSQSSKKKTYIRVGRKLL